MRCVAVLTLALATCDTAPSTPGDDTAPTSAQPSVTEAERASLDSIADALLTAAATDFRDHPPADPADRLRFRDVRMGHIAAPSGAVRYMLCGQFSPAQAADSAAWTPFATILTSPYEQWLGSHAVGPCQDTALIWDPAGDLSASLQERFDSLR